MAAATGAGGGAHGARPGATARGGKQDAAQGRWEQRDGKQRSTGQSRRQGGAGALADCTRPDGSRRHTGGRRSQRRRTTDHGGPSVLASDRPCRRPSPKNQKWARRSPRGRGVPLLGRAARTAAASPIAAAPHLPAPPSDPSFLPTRAQPLCPLRLQRATAEGHECAAARRGRQRPRLVGNNKTGRPGGVVCRQKREKSQGHPPSGGEGVRGNAPGGGEERKG